MIEASLLIGSPRAEGKGVWEALTLSCAPLRSLGRAEGCLESMKSFPKQVAGWHRAGITLVQEQAAFPTLLHKCFCSNVVDPERTAAVSQIFPAAHKCL